MRRIGIRRERVRGALCGKRALRRQGLFHETKGRCPAAYHPSRRVGQSIVVGRNHAKVQVALLEPEIEQ
jgi:hypothetical protein